MLRAGKEVSGEEDWRGGGVQDGRRRKRKRGRNGRKCKTRGEGKTGGGWGKRGVGGGLGREKEVREWKSYKRRKRRERKGLETVLWLVNEVKERRRETQEGLGTRGGE